MINTIFYFVPTLLEYQAKLNSGEIASRTIAFVNPSEGETTGTIYKNGIRYGGYSKTEINNMIDNKAFDPTEILAAITRIEASIESANESIDNLNNSLDDTIQGLIDDTFSQYTWIKKNLSDVFAYSGFISELNNFLTTAGVITETGAKWAALQLSMSEISGRVVDLENATGGITESAIKAWINEGITGINISSYAKKSYAETTRELLSNLTTRVDTLNNSVSTTLSSTISQYLGNDLNSAVDTYLQNQAGLVLDADLDHSVSLLFSRTELESHETLTALNTAGFISESNLDGAIATMFASAGNSIKDSQTYAAILAGLVADDTNTNNRTSFITAVADKINIKGDQVTISSNHGINLDGVTWALVINASDILANNVTAFNQFKVLKTLDNTTKIVSCIDNTGRAIFINGHIYMPYFATDWQNYSSRKTVGLYIDSIPAGSPDSNVASDTTYAIARYGGTFYPRTLFEPHGFAIEDGNKAIMGSVYATPYFETVNNVNEFTSYSFDITAWDTEPYDQLNNLHSNINIKLAPTVHREGHDSSGGVCEITNNNALYNESDPYTWKGKFWAHKWHSAEIEVGDEIHLIAHGSPRVDPEHNEYNESDPLYHGRATGIHVSGNVRIDHASVFESTALLFVPSTNQGSDERMKTIIDNIEPSIEDIAGVRIVDFTFNNDDTNDVHAGTIAQDWQNIVPNAVKPHTYIGTQEEYLTLDYSAVSVVSAVTAAKEIVKLKQENAELKERLAAIEARLAQL